jgi:hypothetical protein
MNTPFIPQDAQPPRPIPQSENRFQEKRKTAVGYVRVSTSMAPPTPWIMCCAARGQVHREAEQPSHQRLLTL